MGFTHYFKQNKPVSTEQWQAFKKDAQVVINHAQNDLEIVLMSNDSNGVMLNDESVNLNGDERYDLDHEPFYLAKDYREFNFCKTARKPYDLVVCSLLLLAHEHMPNHYNIGSDGNFEDWQDAMGMNAKLFGHGFKLPESVDSSDEVHKYEEDLANAYGKKSQSKEESKPSIDIHKTKKSSRYNL